MSDSVERAVHINFDRDERELAPRDTFVVLTGTATEPPACDGRRIGDVYLSNVDPVNRTFDGAWFYAGDHGWKQAAIADLRAHAIQHPTLANRILSISPDGTSVNWSKRDTIIRRERRARTISRSQSQAAVNESLPCPKTPPPSGMRSAPGSPQRILNPPVRRAPPPPLDPAAFVYVPSYAPVSFPPPPPTPRTPQQLSPHRSRFPTTPQSSRSSRTAWSSPASTLFSSPGSRAGYSPPTSLESSPTSPDRPRKYTVPQKRGSLMHDCPPYPPPPIFQLPPAPPPLLPSVEEVPERANAVVDVFGSPLAHPARAPLPALSAPFRPDAPPFIPRQHIFAPPTGPTACFQEHALMNALFLADVKTVTEQVWEEKFDKIERVLAKLLNDKENRHPEIDNECVKEAKAGPAHVQTFFEKMSVAPSPSPKVSKLEAAILRSPS